MLRTALIIMVIFCAKHVFSQDEYMLHDTVIITAQKPFDINREVWSSKRQAFTMSSLSDGLKNVGTAIVQAQSPSSLNTVLIKGMPARHVGMLWNEINLSSSLNGVMDVNLIPNHLIDDIGIFNFGSHASLGNQSMTGGLRMINDPTQQSKSMITASISSLQNIGLSASFKTNSKNTFSKIGFTTNHHKNIYAYDIRKLTGKSKDTNFNQNHFTADFTTLGKKSTWRYGTWLSANQRDLPSSIVSDQIFQKQTDRSIRTYASFEKKINHQTVYLSVNHIVEYLKYYSPGIISIANTNTFQGKAAYYHNSLKAKAYLQWRSDIATPNFFIGTKWRNTFSIGLDKLWTFKSSKLQVTVVQDIVDNKWQTPGASVQWQLKSLTAKLSKTYLLPSLNDLYWPQGGNPLLSPENAIQSEVSYGIRKKSWTLYSSMWSNWVQDWIQWAPSSSGLWSPSNLQRVWSRGLTASLDYTIKSRASKTVINVTPTLLKSEITNHNISPDLIGRQLIYMPFGKISLSGLYTYKKHTIGLYLNGLSKRYDTTDNSESLNAFATIDVKYKMILSKGSEWQLSIHNVNNQMYEMVRFFPMPGINVHINYKVHF